MIALQFSCECLSLEGGGRQLERERLEGRERGRGRSSGKRMGANSFASNRRCSSETITGNLLFLLPPPILPLLFFNKCRQDIVINNQKGRKVPGRSYWKSQIKTSSFPGSVRGQGFVPGPSKKGQNRLSQESHPAALHTHFVAFVGQSRVQDPTLCGKGRWTGNRSGLRQ